MNPQIDFKLPSGAGGMAAGYRSAQLRKRINAWSEEYHITVQIHILRYIFRVEFEKPSDLSWFALTFKTDNSSWDRWNRV